ncbi:MAG: hypothetical protein L0177_02100 [Chloroflexi bacterium]|nr:hypothetical protein [Chloroflexota bacterium]
MRKFGLNSNGGNIKNQIITRRNLMKKQLASLVISGLAVVTVAGAGIFAPMGGAVHADPAGKTRIVAEYAGTSPDLPDYRTEPAKRAMVGTEFAGTSPDLPEIGHGDARVVRAESDLNDDIFGGPSTRVNGYEAGVTSAARTESPLVEDADDIFGGPSTKVGGMQGAAKTGFASVEYVNTSPDLPELDRGDARVVTAEVYRGTSPDLPELEGFYGDVSTAKVDAVSAPEHDGFYILPLPEDSSAGVKTDVERAYNHIPLPWDDAEAAIQLEYDRNLEITRNLVPLPWDDEEAAIQLNHDKALEDHIVLIPMPWDDEEAAIQRNS